MIIKKFVKKGKAKYDIVLDNGKVITLNEEVIINNNLLVNKKIDKDTLNRLLYENVVEELYSKCIKYITVRIRSKKEMLDYIKRYSNDDKIIELIIDKLEKNKYINDDVFTQCFINDKLNLTNYGDIKIRQELKKHNISSSTVEKYISNIDENILREKIDSIISKSIKNNYKYSKMTLISKIYSKLIMLGYSKTLITEELDKFEIPNDENIIKKDYEKIHSKLSTKYEGNELEYLIKQKLTQKGYTYDEINNLLNNI